MSIFTPLDDDDVKAGTLVSVETFSSIADNINYLMDSAAVGKIAIILYGLPGVPIPNPKYWQEVDGSEVTEEDSPIRGTTLPNNKLRGQYLRGCDVIGDVGNHGGDNLKNLRHNHGGTTTILADVDPETLHTNQDNDQYNCTPFHTHTLLGDLSATQNFEPAHIRIRTYMKIR